MKRILLVTINTIFVANLFGSACEIMKNFEEKKLALMQNTIKDMGNINVLLCPERQLAPDKFTSFPLMEVATRSATATNYLLEHGARATINQQNMLPGTTPLMAAAGACASNLEAPTIVAMLLDAGADPHIKTKEKDEQERKTAYDMAQFVLTSFGKLPPHFHASCSLVSQLLKEAPFRIKVKPPSPLWQQSFRYSEKATE